MQSFKEFGEYIIAHSRHGEVASDKVHVIINYPKIQWDDWAEYMATLTWFSGIPLNSGGSKNSHVVFAEDIDQGLAQCNQYKYAMVSYIGSFYYSDHNENIFKYFDNFCESGRPCRGHILWHPDKQYGRLHPQTIFLNLTHWRSIGSPKFAPHTGRVMLPIRSKSNVHDDYTPHWIAPSDTYVNVEGAEHSEYISRVLEDGHTILNLDRERRTKFFCYPERRHSSTLDAEKNRPSNIVYVKNNETIPHFDRKFDVIYAPASGCISEQLFARHGHANTKLVIYDYNDDSIKWKKMLYTLRDIDSVNRHFRRNVDCIVDDCSYKTIKQDFTDQQWMDAIDTIDSPTFLKYDILTGPFDVDATKTNLIYLSNIFAYNYLIHKKGIAEVHDTFNKYLQLPNSTIYGKNIFKDSVIVSTIPKTYPH